MNIHAAAAEIARRIPEMAKDSPLNNASVIEGLLTEQEISHELTRKEIDTVMYMIGFCSSYLCDTKEESKFMLGIAVKVRNRLLGAPE